MSPLSCPPIFLFVDVGKGGLLRCSLVHVEPEAGRQGLAPAPSFAPAKETMRLKCQSVRLEALRIIRKLRLKARGWNRNGRRPKGAPTV